MQPQMFSNIIVNIGSAVVSFHSYKPTGSINTNALLNLPLHWPARKKYKKNKEN